jgi:hypothetical protein
VLLRIGVVLLLLVGACSEEKAAPEAPSKATGVIVDIDTEGLGELRAFKLKDGDQTYEIRIDPKIEYGFNLDHLHEHRATAEPVAVTIDERDGILYATSIDDV